MVQITPPNNENDDRAVSTILSFLQNENILPISPVSSPRPSITDRCKLGDDGLTSLSPLERCNLNHDTDACKEETISKTKFDSETADSNTVSLLKDTNHPEKKSTKSDSVVLVRPPIDHPPSQPKSSGYGTLREWKPSTASLLLPLPFTPTPFLPYDILDHNFGIPFVHRLRDELQRHKVRSKLVPGRTGSDTGTKGITHIRGDWSTFVPLSYRSSPTFPTEFPCLDRLVRTVQETVTERLTKSYVGGQRMVIESEFTSVQIAVYPGDGRSGYPRHCDRGPRCVHENNNQNNKGVGRMITAVYYVTDDDWDIDRDGGCLRVYSPSPDPRTLKPGNKQNHKGDELHPTLHNAMDQLASVLSTTQSVHREENGVETTVHDIVPYADRLVLFRSDLVEHRVLPSKQRERMAVTVWLSGRFVTDKEEENGDEIEEVGNITNARVGCSIVCAPGNVCEESRNAKSQTTKTLDISTNRTNVVRAEPLGDDGKKKPPPLRIDKYDDETNGIDCDKDVGPDYVGFVDLNDVDLDDVEDDDEMDNKNDLGRIDGTNYSKHVNSVINDRNHNILDDTNIRNNNNKHKIYETVSERIQRQDQSRIFVSIPSYRDTETYPTIRSLLQTACFPNRIHIGLVLQYDTHSPVECRLFAYPASSTFDDDEEEDDENNKLKSFLPPTYPHTTNFRTVTLHYTHATGPCLARSLAQSLYRGEDYVLQIDSHMRFRENWDSYLIQQFEKCIRANKKQTKTTTNSKVVLTAYPPGYTLPDECPVGGWEVRGTLLVPWKFDKNGMIRQKGRLIRPSPSPSDSTATNDVNENDNIPCLLYAAGFNFAPASVIFDCPYDPHLSHLFFGEEPSMAVRLFTAGYDLYAPPETVCYHLWDRSYRRTFQTDAEGVQKTKQQSVVPREEEEEEKEKEKRTTKAEDRRRSLVMVHEQLKGTGRGLGTVRKVEEFARRLGVDFSDRGVVFPGAENGGLDPKAFVGVTVGDGGVTEGVEDGDLARRLFTVMFADRPTPSISGLS